MKLFCCNLFLIVLIFDFSSASDSTPCEACRTLVDGLLKGFDRTISKNFGGGDVDWEEKRKLKYKTSELRLIEIMESACPSDDFQCNKLLEEHEEDIEKWYKKSLNKQPISLQDFLCVETAQVCCPENKFGEECEACPVGSDNEICSGHGKCEGAGDKQGSGKCACSDGFAGDLCDECGDGYFKADKNDTSAQCERCHETCATCKGGNSTDCETCAPGYREETDTKEEGQVKCVDVNECVEQRDLCPVGQYCVNTEGSYSCEGCRDTCSSCFGPSARHCYSCKRGSIMRVPYMCQDIDECASGAICLGMYEVCVNTPGHYKCECARFFRRDPVSGQCQPDPAIYSRYMPEKPKQKKEGEGVCQGGCHDQDDHRRYLEAVAKLESSSSETTDDASTDDTQESLSNDDIQRLVVAFIICLLGTAAAKGDIFWNLMFFLSLFLCAIWWASDKSDRIVSSFSRSGRRSEL